MKNKKLEINYKNVYSDQIKFNKEPENDKWKKSHREVFMDVEKDSI